MIEKAKIDISKIEKMYKIFQIYEDSAKYYNKRLYKDEVSKKAREYIRKRRINQDCVDLFEIGYSGNKNELYKHLKKRGYSDEDIEESKICIRLEDGKFADFFQRRLMIPIKDEYKRVIAFTGRKIDNKEIVRFPKYLNSVDNLIFKKRKKLYGLDFIRYEKENVILLVEGTIDVIKLYENGIYNAIASLGTAFTQEHAELIKKYTDKVILSYDADLPGQNANLHVGELLIENGIEVSVLQYDVLEIKDPDEYINEYGAERFKNLIKNAIPFIEFKVKMLEKEYDLNKTSDKITFLKSIAEMISNLKSEIEKEVYIDKFSEKYNVSKEALKEYINLLEKKK